jgi:threonine dehydrogenase-like Zn-dependent dehydrogenase
MVRSDTMRALVTQGGRLDLTERPVPAIPGECLVRVSLAGICGTDLGILDGYAAFTGIPGHEFVGVVENAHDDAAGWLGRRVVGEINIGCGICRVCRDGVREHCSARTVVGIRARDGAFAEYVSLPAANLHAVPDSVADEEAVFVEPLAAACRLLQQVSLSREREVAVVGDGRLALLIVQVLREAGVRPSVIGRHEEKLSLARSWGAETMTSAASGDVKDRFDLVVDATGHPSGLETALAIVRPRGTIVLKSTFHGTAGFATWPIVVDEVTIVGSRCGPFPTALDLLARRVVDVRPLVSGTFSLADHSDAFEAARRGLKVLFNPRLQ